MAEQPEGVEVALPVELEFIIPSDMVSRYATHVVSQFGPNEFVISFFEAESPVLTGTPEQNLEALRQIGKVPAKCVARIVVAPARMPEFVDVLQRNLTQYTKVVQSVETGRKQGGTDK